MLGGVLLCVIALSAFPVVTLSVGFVPPPHPNYTALELYPPSKIVDDPVFIKACADMAGYYSDSGRNPALNKTLIMAGINFSYKNFYHNFKCFTDRLGLKFLPIALDKAIYSYLESLDVPTFLMPRIEGRSNVTTSPAKFGDEPFNLIGCRKIEAVGGALRLGYDVVFSDVDIAILRDPLPYLFIEGVDYVHSKNAPCSEPWKFSDEMEGNTGFYAVKSNEVTIRTWDLTYRACSQAPLYDDQTMFWLILRTNQHPAPAPLTQCPLPTLPPRTVSYSGASGASSSGTTISTTTTSTTTSSRSQAGIGTGVSKHRHHQSIRTCPLDGCLFSAGGLKDSRNFGALTNNLKSAQQPAQQPAHQKAVAVHANWVSGNVNKIAALRSKGLWVAENPAAAAQESQWRKQERNEMHARQKRDMEYRQRKRAGKLQKRTGKGLGKGKGFGGGGRGGRGGRGRGRTGGVDIRTRTRTRTRSRSRSRTRSLSSPSEEGRGIKSDSTSTVTSTSTWKCKEPSGPLI